MKENQIRLSCEKKTNQKDANQSSYSTGDANGCITTKINCSSVDDFDDNVVIIRESAAESNKKPSDAYVDKSVMQCQLSKAIVCYKDINVNDVKDICIDEWVSSPEHIFFESTDEKSICKIFPSEEDQNEGSIKEQENSSEVWKLIADDLNLSDLGRDWTTFNNSKDLIQIEEAKFNASDPEHPTQALIEESHSSKSLDYVQNGVEIMDLQNSGERAELKNSTSVSTVVEPRDGNSVVDSAAELPSDGSLTNALIYNGEVENGSITFNFDSLPHVANGEEESQGNANLNCPVPMARPAVTEECCQSRDSADEAQVSTNLETGAVDPRLVSSQIQLDIGESSFSVVDPLASLMNHSGLIAYSGSISLRSESSAASTRSFAFPILQSEWNSSPVKMVKAERRHYRKYRGWREGLLCCKF